MPNNLLKWAWLPILVIFGLAASPHLGYPSYPVFDEIYTATAAQEIVEGRVPHEQTHPPLSKLMMAVGYQFWMGGQFQEATQAWSPIAFAIRTPSVVFALFSLALLFLLGSVLFEDRRKATLAMGLLACDSLFLVMSRTAMTNIYGMCFTLLCSLGSALAITRRDPRWLFLAGLGLGLGGASRWTALVGGGLCVLCGVGFLAGSKATPREWARWVGYAFVGMAIFPIAIYLASYFPQVWVATHHDLGKVFSYKTADYLMRVHRWAVAAHKLLDAPNPDFSMWYTWPFMLQPTWFYFTRTDATHYLGIWGIGNGLIWWATLPMLAYGAFQGLVRKRYELLFPTVLAAGLWLVWAPANSHINYLHYMFEAVPFICLLLADVLVRAWDAAGARRVAAGAYAGLVVGWAIWFYPLLTAEPVTESFYRAHLLVPGRYWDTELRLATWRKEQGLESEAAYKAFLNKWYPDPEGYLKFLKEEDELKRRQRAQQQPPQKSPEPK